MSCDCGDHGEVPEEGSLTRRSFLSVGFTAFVSLLLPSRVAAQQLKTTTGGATGVAATGGGRPLPAERYGLVVRPRSDWAKGLNAKGALPAEPDVRFLLVHHSASSNKYSAADVPGIIRGFYGFHTGSEKGWPDVAYNFFIDKFGTAWEARTGSLNSAVSGSATGGNQGYSQLVCLIGDYAATPPTAPQLQTLERLLAALADRHKIDTSPGAIATFESKGSNRHKRGVTVETPTINGHRSMSMTSCPGDSAFAKLADIRVGVHRLRTNRA
jgi:N-acetylmuramoyl-L-alanine amidase